MADDLQTIGSSALAKAPQPLRRALDGLNTQFRPYSGSAAPMAGGLGPNNQGIIAGVEKGSPNTISVMQPDVFAKNADQLATHEATHEVQNNWAPAIQNAIPPDNSADPYNFGGTAGIKSLLARGGTIANMPREQAAAAMQYGQSQGMPEPYNQLAHTLDRIPQSTIEMTNPMAKTINMHPRAPQVPPSTVPGMNFAQQTYQKGQPAPGDDDIPAGWSRTSASSVAAGNDIPAGWTTAPIPKPSASGSGAPTAPSTPRLQKAFGANPISDTLSSVGSHLANMVTGPYHAFTDAPQNAAEQRIKNLPGNSGIMGQLDLGAARMFAEPTIRAAQQVGTQAKAGNYGLGAKDTTYDDQGNYKPTAFSSAMDAVPIAGPWARQVETEAHQKGAVPALAGLAIDALAPREIAKVGGLGLRAAGKAAQAASATPESLRLFGTRALTNGTPGELLQSALKPAARYGGNVPETLHESLPYALKADPNLQGVSGFARAADKARNAQFGQYDDLIAPYRKLQPGTEGPVRPRDIHGGPIAKAQMLSIPPMDLIEDNPTPGRLRRFEVPDPEGGTLRMGAQEEPRGGIVQRTKQLGEKYNRPMSIPLMDAVREDANAKLNSFYNKAGGDQAAALSNPETARVKAVEIHLASCSTHNWSRMRVSRLAPWRRCSPLTASWQIPPILLTSESRSMPATIL